MKKLKAQRFLVSSPSAKGALWKREFYRGFVVIPTDLPSSNPSNCG
ncbi:hypothetical protein LEP1GSC188_5087 [Leptospira weilii serovar Topaz str. LT2116]|uniref:Uncharacterized protein n=1 Tax=Leptospira weilii serovar Topaz str. LT2116 TaxID=1088540 RepID=M3FLV5_9LEPT|nr:hypothetical protein LEP1GSC188_5087 [Leptospira weilii serovar Topaz str. LT2116]